MLSEAEEKEIYLRTQYTNQAYRNAQFHHRNIQNSALTDRYGTTYGNKSERRVHHRSVLWQDFTPVIASHNMRELEDVCDHVGFLHKGGILLSRELEDMKFHIHKIQCVLPDQTKEEALLKELDVLKKEHQGSLLILTARGTREEILQKVQTQNPIFCEVIPLTLEEIFISETEVAGYEVKNIFW